jgi:hypothetical protein
MNKSIIFLLIILIFVSCKQKSENVNINDELKWKTFDLIAESEKDTLIIDFRDSTYQMFQHQEKELPFRISKFDNSNYLVLDRGIMAIKKSGTDFYEGLFLGETDYKVKMVRRNKNWNKEMLYGKWIEEKYWNTKKENLPPPPPPLSESGYDWPPYYQIDKNKITLNLFKVSESNIDINNSAEFINMELNNPIIGIEEKWRIKELNDSIMIINKLIETGTKFEFMNKYSEDIKLIKKR